MDTRNSINIYGCGGFGINVLNLLAKQPLAGAEYTPYFIDTSDSNLLNTQKGDKNVYLIPGCDGSGKNPALNHPRIVQVMPQVADKFAPADINIIVMALSGGSGNVIGLELAEAIWKEGKGVIFYSIASREDLTAVTNVRNMLASMRNKAQAYGKSAVMYFDDNQQATQDNQVDGDMITSISAFLELYSGNHLRLDSTDIRNWLNPKVESQILLLDIAVSYDVASEVPAPLSIATLYDSEETRTKVIPSMRSCEGIRKRACGHNLYLIISGSGVDRIVDSISSSITDYKQAAVNNSSANMRGLDKLKPTGPSGMVFED